MNVENASAIKRIEALLNDVQHELYRLEANNEISDNCKYPTALI